MQNTFFLHQIKHTSDTYTKGIVVHDTFPAAKQGYHAYLGAYAYGHDPDTDYVSCMITDLAGRPLDPWCETWEAEPVIEEEEEEETPEEEEEAAE